MKNQIQTASEVKNSSRIRTLAHETRKKTVKIICMLSTVAVIAIIAGVLAGCQQEVFFDATPEMSVSKSISLAPDEFVYFGEVIKLKEGELIWQKQLSLCLENNDRIKDNELALVGYKYIGKIGSIEELGEIKSDILRDAVFPVYSSQDCFAICKKDDMSLDILSMLMPTSKIMMIDQEKTPPSQYLFEVGDAGVVELEWIYKGNKLNTIALVSDKKGIVYDNLLYYIHFQTSGECKTEVLKTTPRLKSGNESGSGKPDGSFTLSISSKNEIRNLLGMIVVEWDVSCSIPYTRLNGQVSILGYTSRKYSNAAWGFNCVADIQKRSEQMGANGYIDVVWAGAYGSGVSLTIGWNGSGFTISGGGTHFGGEASVNSYYLNNL